MRILLGLALVVSFATGCLDDGTGEGSYPLPTGDETDVGPIDDDGSLDVQVGETDNTPPPACAQGEIDCVAGPNQPLKVKAAPLPLSGR